MLDVLFFNLDDLFFQFDLRVSQLVRHVPLCRVYGLLKSFMQDFLATFPFLCQFLRFLVQLFVGFSPIAEDMFLSY
jgi:hypothetical protein